MRYCTNCHTQTFDEGEVCYYCTSQIARLILNYLHLLNELQQIEAEFTRNMLKRVTLDAVCSVWSESYGYYYREGEW